ncbi:hypothetical protein J6590_018364 [Homalodisca vitripennis]|nr:hypothetical protein J6590_018364 [Homalodisca vitripennis]
MIRSPISTGFLSSVGLAETWKQFNHGLLNRTFTPDTTCNGRDGTWELDNQKTYRRSTHPTHVLFRYKFLLKWRTRLRTVLLPNDLLGHTGWSQQNQQIPQPAAAKAATGIGLLPLNNSVEIN